MTTTFTRTAIAAVFAAATVGMAGTATAGVKHVDTDKATYETKAVPAAQVVERGTGPTAAGPTEKANQIARTTPAFQATGIKGTFVATHPTGKGDVRR
jgi:hypothetical protein